MINVAKIVGFLLTTIAAEDPAILRDAAVEQAWRERIEQAVELGAKVTREAGTPLVSREADLALLLGVQYYESRFRQEAEGDCSMEAPPRLAPADDKRLRNQWGILPRALSEPKKVCRSFGLMQVGVSLWRFVDVTSPRKDRLALLKESPLVNVQTGYSVLAHHKVACGGTPGTWITAYGRGNCPKARRAPKGPALRVRLAEKLADVMELTAEQRPALWGYEEATK